MKCPKCKVEIEDVFVISEFTQLGLLKGNVIVEYDNDVDDPIGNTIRILCKKCFADITKFVKEK